MPRKYKKFVEPPRPINPDYPHKTKRKYLPVDYDPFRPEKIEFTTEQGEEGTMWAYPSYCCPHCENPIPFRASYKKTTRFLCSNCQKEFTFKDAIDYLEKGLEILDNGKMIHRLHRRLAEILMDGHTVALCKSSRAEMGWALKDMLEIGWDEVFEHLMMTTECTSTEPDETPDNLIPLHGEEE